MRSSVEHVGVYSLEQGLLGAHKRGAVVSFDIGHVPSSLSEKAHPPLQVDDYEIQREVIKYYCRRLSLLDYWL